jgi:hypothetical protein
LGKAAGAAVKDNEAQRGIYLADGGGNGVDGAHGRFRRDVTGRRGRGHLGSDGAPRFYRFGCGDSVSGGIRLAAEVSKAEYQA